MRSETLSIVTAPSKSYLSAQIAPSIPPLITFLACLIRLIVVITNMLPLEQHYKRVLFQRPDTRQQHLSVYALPLIVETPNFWEWNLSAGGGNHSLKCLMSFSARNKLKKLLNKWNVWVNIPSENCPFRRISKIAAVKQMNHPNTVRSTNSIKKFICQIQNEMNLPKCPPPGVWVSLGVNWSDGRDSVNDGKGRQSTHNHRTTIAQSNTNKLSTHNQIQTNTNTTTQTNYQLTTKYKQIVIPQPNTTKYKHNHTNKLSTQNQIQTNC